MTTERKYGKHLIVLSHADKPMFGDSGISKGDLVDYYARIAEYMLPHLAGRPLTLHRFPDGIGQSGFYQQARGSHFPDWMPGLKVDHGGETGTLEHVLCNSQAALAYLANQGVIALHAWLSRKEALDAPDQLVLDLDPPDRNFEPARQAAQHVRALCSELGLPAFVKTTGSRGLHVVVPLRPEAPFDAVRVAARTLAERLAERWPEELTTAQRKNKRGRRVYVDVMRNAFGQTAVAPYSVRALPEAPIATPLDWEELDDRSVHARSFDMSNIFRRLGQKDDPWSRIRRHAIGFKTLRRALESPH